MPNLPGRGLFGRPAELGPGPGLPAVNIVGSLAGSTVPRQVIRLFASDDNGTPVEVWARTAAPVTSASLVYVAFARSVTVSWVQPSPIEADTWEIRRPDGSLAGIVTWNGTGTAPTSFSDVDPRPLSGSYTVTAKLGNTTAAAVATPTLNLAAPPAGLNAAFSEPYVVLSWSHPAYGPPDSYEVWRLATINGIPTRTHINTLPGSSTSYNDGSPHRGAASAYELIPILSGYGGQNASDSVNVPALPPAILTATRVGTTLTFGWVHNSGARTGYEIQWELDPGSFGASSTFTGPDATSVSITDSPPNPWYFRVRTLATGGSSAWYQAGPILANSPT